MIVPLNHFKYVDENLSRDQIKKHLEIIVKNHVEKRQGTKNKNLAKSESLFELEEE